MPELPEVEIVKQSLNKSITGKTIRDILIKNRNLSGGIVAIHSGWKI